MTEPRNILIVRTDRIGDVVLSLPMANVIKQHFPGCRVTFLVREYTKPLPENYTGIDKTLVLKEENGKISFAGNYKLIKEGNYDACIIVNPKFVTALLLFLCRIKTRIGSGYRWYSFLFNKKVFEHRKDAKRHELEYNVNLLKPLGIEYTASRKNIHFNLKPDKEMREMVKNELLKSGINLEKGLVVIHPGSGGSAIDLPLSKFKEIVKGLSGKGYAICITGSLHEKQLCESIKVSPEAVNLAGRFTLPELISLISLASVFVSNSTGPIHIAAALGVSVVGFYPKLRECSPERWGPYSEKAKVFQPEIDCKICTREQCGRLNCMSSINSDKIVSYIEKILVSFT
jgi:lipopolysaccharide heptosyltransferase II